MSLAGEMISNYNKIHQRLVFPPNAVPDKGINLRNRIPPKEVPLPPPPMVLVEATRQMAVVRIIEIPPPPLEPVLPRKVCIAAVERAVCHHFKITRKALQSPARTNLIVYPRHVLCYLARSHTGLSYPQIGRRLGGRDHTTTLHGYRRIKEMLLVDERTQAIIKLLEFVIFAGYHDSETDLPRLALAAEPKLDLAKEQSVSVSES